MIIIAEIHKPNLHAFGWEINICPAFATIKSAHHHAVVSNDKTRIGRRKTNSLNVVESW